MASYKVRRRYNKTSVLDTGTTARRYYKYGNTPNVDVVGVPTINGMVVSGFSTANYVLTRPQAIIKYTPTADNWEMVFKINFVVSSAIQSIWCCGDTGYCARLRINTSEKITFQGGNSSSSYNVFNITGTTTLVGGTDYWIKCEFTGEAYNLYSAKEWTTPANVGGSNNLQDITYGNGKFVAVGNSGCIITSTDGITWTTTTVGSNVLSGVTYDNGKFVAVGNSGCIITSTDGVTWTTTAVGLNDWLDVAYGNGIFVAVGYPGYIATSTDGITWSTDTVGSNAWYGVTYGDGIFVAVGNSGYIATSTDGIIWAIDTVGSTNWLDVAHGNGKFVAVGNSGYIATSTDGLTWTTATVGSNAWYGVTYGRSKFVAVGVDGYIVTSTDGLTWTTATVGSNHWFDITCGNNIFIAVGANGYTATSSDYINWTLEGTKASTTKLTYGGHEVLGFDRANAKYPLTSSLDLAGCYYKVNGGYLWRGIQPEPATEDDYDYYEEYKVVSTYCPDYIPPIDSADPVDPIEPGI